MYNKNGDFMKVYRLSAFPKTPYGGNKAGVVLDASTLTETEMQAIANEVGYSETAFVLPSTNADFKVRFFTPVNEVDLCGHATIATFSLLRQLSIISNGQYTQETKAGILRLHVEDDNVFMEQNPPLFGEIVNSHELEKCFMNTDFIHPDYPIQVVSTALREIFLPVRSNDLLDDLKPNFNEIEEWSKRYNVIGIHAFALDEEVDAYGRNFAPIVGIREESATGTSSGALTCYLYRYVNNKTTRVLRQGYAMGQPSEINTKLDIKQDAIQSVWVGGTAIQIEK